MKNPEECKNMTDIRQEIDCIDKNIIALIAKRARYVYKAAEFKTDQKSVKAPDRVKAMLQKRGEWAEEHNINPKVIMKIYKELVDYFISEEMNRFNKIEENQ